MSLVAVISGGASARRGCTVSTLPQVPAMSPILPASGHIRCYAGRADQRIACRRQRHALCADPTAPLRAERRKKVIKPGTVDVPIKDGRVLIPSIGAWNGGYLEL